MEVGVSVKVNEFYHVTDSRLRSRAFEVINFYIFKVCLLCCLQQELANEQRFSN